MANENFERIVDCPDDPSTTQRESESSIRYGQEIPSLLTSIVENTRIEFCADEVGIWTLSLPTEKGALAPTGLYAFTIRFTYEDKKETVVLHLNKDDLLQTESLLSSALPWIPLEKLQESYILYKGVTNGKSTLSWEDPLLSTLSESYSIVLVR